MAETRIEGLALAEARDGSTVLLAKLAGGRSIYLHSAYSPQDEARRWSRELQLGRNDVVILLGAGAGYPAKAILEQCGPANFLIAVEPDPRLAETAAELASIQELKRDFRFAVRNSWPQVQSLFESLELSCWRRVHLMVWPVYRELFPDACQSLSREVFRLQNSLSTLRNTVERFAGTWQENLFANLPALLASTPVARIFGKAKGLPAVIVSAGPSLEKNIDLLAEAYGRALIIATAPAARLMSAKSLRADMILTVDPGDCNYLAHFEGIDHGSTLLVFDPTVGPAVLRNHRGPHSCILVFPDCTWLESFSGEPLGLVKTGGSVSNIAFDLACQLDANPVIFIGQDLAFTDNLSHARGTFFDGYDHNIPAAWAQGDYEALNRQGQIDQRVAAFSKIERILVPAVDGGLVATDRKLFEYLSWFEKEIRSIGGQRVVIDSTEGGALIRGTQLMRFKEALEVYCQTNIQDRLDSLHAVLGRSPRWDAAGLEHEIATLIPVTAATLTGVRKLTDLLGAHLAGVSGGRPTSSAGPREDEMAALGDTVLKGVDRLKTRLHFALTPFLLEAQEVQPGFDTGPEMLERKRALFLRLSTILSSSIPILEIAVSSLKNRTSSR